MDAPVMDSSELADELGLDDHERPMLDHWCRALDDALDAGAAPDATWALLIAGFWADHLGLDAPRRGVLAARVVETVVDRRWGTGAQGDPSARGTTLDAATATIVFDRCIDALADRAEIEDSPEAQTALEIAAAEIMRLRDSLDAGHGADRSHQTGKTRDS